MPLLALTCAVIAAPANAAIGFVQANSTATNTASTSVTVTYASAQGAGDLNVITIGWEDSTTNISSVIDSRGNSYTLAVGPTRNSGHNSLAIYYAKNIVAAGAGANTVTVTFSTAAAGPDIRIAEYSGIDTSSPLDASNGNTGTGTTPTTAGMTTTAATELIVGADQLANSTSGVGSGFTSRVTSSHGHVLEDRIVTATGSYTASVAQASGGYWTMNGATFRAAAADTQAPTAPTGLSATAASASQINLSWTASTDNIAVTGYRIERCAGASCTSFVEVATASSTAFSDTGLSASTTYRYRIRAQDAVPNFSSYSTLASASTPAVSIGFVQAGSFATNTASASVTVSYSAAQLAGDLNVVVIGWEDSTTNITSVTDTKGNAYALAVGPIRNSGHNSLAIYYAKNITAATAGGNTVTVIFSGSAAGPDVRIGEYSGIDTASPLDASNGAIGTGTTPSTGSMTTTSANELIVGADQLANSTTGAGSGFTTRVTSSHGHILEDRTVTSTGSYTASVSQASGGYWTMVGATFRAGGGGADTSVPTAPSGLSASAVSSSQINLTWTGSTDNVGVTAYHIERCQGSGCTSFAEVGTSATTTYADTGRGASTSYSYRVRAQDAVPNFSAYSNTASATTPAGGDTQAPTAPSGLVIVASSSKEIDLAWSGSTDNVAVTGYVIERCSGASCATFSTASTVGATFTVYDDAGRTGSTSYTYRVRARDAAGNLSSPSNLVTTVTPAASADCN